MKRENETIMLGEFNPEERLKLARGEAIAVDLTVQNVEILRGRLEQAELALAGMLFAFDDGVGQTWSADVLDFARKLVKAKEFDALQQGEQATAAENAQVGESFGEIGADGWRKIGKPAMVGAVSFGVGISSRLVVEAAQRHHEYSQEPAVEAERMQRISNFVASVREDQPEQAEGAQGEREVIRRLIAVIDGIDNDGCFKDLAEYNSAMEAARAALAQPSPVQTCTHPDCGRFYDHNAKRWACRAWADNACAADHAQPSPAPEVERPEVVGTVKTMGFGRLYAEGFGEPIDKLKAGDELMAVAQHERILRKATVAQAGQVPEEPTEAMLHAGMNAMKEAQLNGSQSLYAYAGVCWDAMIAAAQAQGE